MSALRTELAAYIESIAKQTRDAPGPLFSPFKIYIG